jgi:hypothetical protein
MPLQSIFIVSVPRSGSTLLTNLLDANEDVICPPESFFPAVLEMIDSSEMRDRRKIAALFVVSCSDGSPLTLDEAEACVQVDKQQTLDALALAIARKLGRDPELILTAVWKFTRMVGCWKFANGIGGKFIVLHRNLLNVYESQFRVPFGAKNKNPARFALFAASYDAAFSGYPNERTLRLNYPEIPSRMTEIVRWIGSSGNKRDTDSNSQNAVTDTNPWHANINKPFDNRDAEKLRNLRWWQSAGFRLTRTLLKPMGPLNRKARLLADQRQMAALRSQADDLLKHT